MEFAHHQGSDIESDEDEDMEDDDTGPPQAADGVNQRNLNMEPLEDDVPLSIERSIGYFFRVPCLFSGERIHLIYRMMQKYWPFLGSSILSLHWISSISWVWCHVLVGPPFLTAKKMVRWVSMFVGEATGFAGKCLVVSSLGGGRVSWKWDIQRHRTIKIQCR